MPAANNHEPVIDHLAEVWSSLIGVCQGIGTRQWELATDCPGWTVRDQLSHLIGVERMLLGEPAPAPLADLPDHVHNPFGELNESWVEARRATPGGTVLDEFVETANLRIDELRTSPPERFDVVGWSPVGEIPYRDYLATRVLDGWAHEQDVRRALGRPGGRNGVGESIVLDRCTRTMPFVVGKRVAPPDGTSVLFSVTGVLGRQILVLMDGGRAGAIAVGPTVPSVALTMDQETFWRLGLGRVDPPRVLASSQARVDGDIALGHRVMGSMAFMI